MSCNAKNKTKGYRCPVRGCDKRNNRRFTAIGLTQHIIAKHGYEEFEKRMKVKEVSL